MSTTPNTLNLLLEYLKEVGPYVLASLEDANYFRASVKTRQPIPQEKAVSPPIIQTKDIVIEKMPPPSIIAIPKQLAETNIALPPVIQPKERAPIPTPHLAPVTKLNFSSIKNIISTVAPELPILIQIPDDTIAYKISEKWKTKNKSAPISVLIFQEPQEQKELLEQVAAAIDIYFGPAKVIHAETIEKEKQWEAFLSVSDLKMIIVCDYTLWQLSSLMHFYKETPAQGIRTLGNVPLFLLPDLSLYLRDPLLKRSLWKALCQKCS